MASAMVSTPLRRGFLAPSNGLRGSHCGAAAAVEALSCGRDRVRWPVPLAGAAQVYASGRAGRVSQIPSRPARSCGETV